MKILIGLAMCAAALSGVLMAAPIEPPEDRVPTEWLGPQRLNASSAGIGNKVEDVALSRLFGGRVSLHAAAGSAGTVIVARDPECPVSRVYGPRLARMARTYQSRGFNFVILYLNELIGPVSLARDAAGFDGPAVFVTQGAFNLAERLGIKSTGDVFVLDAQHVLRYRGAVDDQYGIGFTRDLPSDHLLRDALDAVATDQPVAIPATSAPGCYIDADPNKDEGFEPITAGQVVS